MMLKMNTYFPVSIFMQIYKEFPMRAMVVHLLMIMTLTVNVVVAGSQSEDCVFKKHGYSTCCDFPQQYMNRSFSECMYKPGHYSGWCGDAKCIRKENKCGGNRFHPAGVLSSNNYPESYSNISECSWIIDTQKNVGLILNFTNFDLGDCDSSSLMVHDGINASFPVLGKFCGNNVPVSVNTSSGSMFVAFKSTSNSGGKTGFRAYYDTGLCKVRAYGGENSVDQCCFFPFTYKNTSRSSCIQEPIDKQPWCSLTSNYDRDKKRGFCINEAPCRSDEFTCHNSYWWRQCLDNSMRCNMIVDCADGSDETGCGMNPAGCEVLHLISRFKMYVHRQCSQQNDRCANISITCKGEGQNESCPKNYFKCDNNRCIIDGWKCDGKNDCGDMSDEKDCSTNNQLTSEDACSWSTRCDKCWTELFVNVTRFTLSTIASCKNTVGNGNMPEYLPRTTTIFHMTKTQLKTLTSRFFENYPSLVKLLLPSNQINTLQPETFQYASKLQHL